MNCGEATFTSLLTFPFSILTPRLCRLQQGTCRRMNGAVEYKLKAGTRDLGQDSLLMGNLSVQSTCGPRCLVDSCFRIWSASSVANCWALGSPLSFSFNSVLQPRNRWVGQMAQAAAEGEEIYFQCKEGRDLKLWTYGSEELWTMCRSMHTSRKPLSSNCSHEGSVPLASLYTERLGTRAEHY